MSYLACVSFKENGRNRNYVVPVENIRSFAPTHARDFSATERYLIKWQKSDLDHDGFYEGNILCLGADDTEITEKCREMNIRIHGNIPRALGMGSKASATSITPAENTSSEKEKRRQIAHKVYADKASKERQHETLKKLKKKQELERKDQEKKASQDARASTSRGSGHSLRKHDTKDNSGHEILEREGRKEPTSAEKDWKAAFLKLQAIMRAQEASKKQQPEQAPTTPPKETSLGSVSTAAPKKGKQHSLKSSVTPEKTMANCSTPVKKRRRNRSILSSACSDSEDDLTEKALKKRSKVENQDRTHSFQMTATSLNRDDLLDDTLPVTPEKTAQDNKSVGLYERQESDDLQFNNFMENLLSDSESELSKSDHDQNDRSSTSPKILKKKNSEKLPEVRKEKAASVPQKEPLEGEQPFDDHSSDEETVIKRVFQDLKGEKLLEETNDKVYLGSGIYINAEFWKQKIRNAKSDKKFAKYLALGAWGHDMLKVRTVGGKSNRPGVKMATPSKVKLICAAAKGRLQAGGIPASSYPLYMERVKQDINQKMYDEAREDKPNYRENVKKWNAQRKLRLQGKPKPRPTE